MTDQPTDRGKELRRIFELPDMEFGREFGLHTMAWQVQSESTEEDQAWIMHLQAEWDRRCAEREALRSPEVHDILDQLCELVSSHDGNPEACEQILGLRLEIERRCAEREAEKAELAEATGELSDIDSEVPVLFECYDGTDEVDEDRPVPLYDRVVALRKRAEDAEAELERLRERVRDLAEAVEDDFPFDANAAGIVKALRSYLPQPQEDGDDRP